MKERKTPLGFYNYTVVLTYAGMLSAFVSILMSINGRFLDAAIFLMVSGFCDMFDGMVASTRKRTEQEQRFGIQIDSLSDLVSFGVTPAIFVYMITDRKVSSMILTALFVLAALIRLAYFNVLEEERQKTTEGRRTAYLGIPVTPVSVLLPFVYLLEAKGLFRGDLPYLILLFLCAAGFITPVEIRKPGLKVYLILVLIGVLITVGMLIKDRA
ncbi:MAG: CDP-alcohol phosphatidyltransferase family protein [Lachnospiraceae bacterium]|nr:CDP-alcohol phosphatidyltransferase family protein [Lachnospiraceae bacterium]